MPLLRWFREWRYRRQRWQRLVWALYDAGMLNPGAPPPPFKRPTGRKG